jgi:hypothetical protein
LDILVSTGSGHARRANSRTTIYSKTDSTYLLKLKSSRSVYSEIQKKFGAFPFNVRDLDDEKRSRMGVQECKEHGLLIGYEVLYEKDGNIKIIPTLIAKGNILRNFRLRLRLLRMEQYD